MTSTWERLYTSCRTSGLGVVLLYGFTSGGMSFLNKTILTSFHYDCPDVLMLVQSLAIVACLPILHALHLVEIVSWSLRWSLHFLIPSFCFALHTTLALAALEGLSIPVYNVLRRLLPVANLIAAGIAFHKKPPTAVAVSVFIIGLSCVLTGIQDYTIHPMAYACAITSVAAQCIYLTWIEKSWVDEKLSALSILYLNSINCIPMLAVYSLLSGSWTREKAVGFLDPYFLGTFCMDITCGCLLNYSLFLCATHTSALTTSVVGVLKGVITTMIGFFTFGGAAPTPTTLVGVTLNTVGGALYSYVKYQSFKSQPTSLG